MPELFPRHYWLFHSLWHVLLAAGYYELYALIEAESLAAYKEARRHKHVRGKKQRQARGTKRNPPEVVKEVALVSEARADVSNCPFNSVLYVCGLCCRQPQNASFPFACVYAWMRPDDPMLGCLRCEGICK